MRLNAPVTGKEYPLPPDNQTLVSVTDLKGRITYCNEAFIAVSGFTRMELLGQPHNIVRHPDMPEEAFRDLWATVQSGLPWTGVVKNRRKDGDHYWVVAHATPTRDGDRITGYLSVRTAATRAEIKGAEQLYQRFNQQARSGRKNCSLRAGVLISHSPWGWLQQMINRLMPWRLIWLQALLASVAFLCAQQLPWHLALAATSLAFAWTSHVVLKRVLRPLTQLLADARRLGAGDLVHPVTLNTNGLTGHLQKALEQIQLNVRTIVSDARTDVDGLKLIVQEIAAGNEDLSARTEAQAHNVEITAASIQQITGTVEQSANSARRGSGLAADTNSVTQLSKEAVQTAAHYMEAISDSSKRIGDIIQVVEGVAFQTNILALNAAVEAARAGEAGRGFAVVASEVRQLAHRTADAAKDIKNLIRESTDRVGKGSLQVQHASTQAAEALSAVDQVSVVLNEICAAADEQQAGISQINQAVIEIDAITQQNAAMVEQLAASAKALHGRVDTVSVSTRLFRLRPNEKTVAEMDARELRHLQRQAA